MLDSPVDRWAASKLQEKYPKARVLEARMGNDISHTEGCDTCGYGEDYSIHIMGKDEGGKSLWVDVKLDYEYSLPKIIEEIISFEEE